MPGSYDYKGPTSDAYCHKAYQAAGAGRPGREIDRLAIHQRSWGFLADTERRRTVACCRVRRSSVAAYDEQHHGPLYGCYQDARRRVDYSSAALRRGASLPAVSG